MNYVDDCVFNDYNKNKFKRFILKTPEHFKESVFNGYVENQFKKDLLLTLEDNILLKEIAQKSTIHSNGFAKIVLGSFSGMKLRLHIWPQLDREQEHEPHSHRWDFISYILNGVMINEIFIESNEENKTFLKCEAHGTNIGNNRKYEIIDKKGLSLKEKFIYKKGEVYALNGENIHVAKIPKQTITGTLFLTTEPIYHTSNVYMPNLTLPPSELVLFPMKQEELIKYIKQTLEWLK